jgi:hypothetical protein
MVETNDAVGEVLKAGRKGKKYGIVVSTRKRDSEELSRGGSNSTER